MGRVGFTIVVAMMVALCAGAESARGQCEHGWEPLEGYPGVRGVVRAVTEWDPDGEGPEQSWLILGGSFSEAGPITAKNVVAWDGTQWRALGDGLDNTVWSLTVFNGAIIAGGQFNQSGETLSRKIAIWNGSNWAALGSGIWSTVRALEVYENELYAAGETLLIDSQPHNVIRWNGTMWEPVGGYIDDIVYSMTVWDNELVIGGRFTWAGDGPANYIARWDGTGWNSFGTPISNPDSARIYAVCAYNGDLYAGGDFTSLEGVALRHIARWTESGWQPVSFLSSHVYSLRVFGGRLIAGGRFTTTSPELGVGAWNGNVWEPIYANLPFVYALGEYRGQLIAGGDFAKFVGIGVTRWDGNTWEPIGYVTSGPARGFAAHHGKLFLCGDFRTSMGKAQLKVAEWDGIQTSSVGGGIKSLDKNQSFVYGYCTASFHDDLFVGGLFSKAGDVGADNIARWNGSSWNPVGTGVTATVFAMLEWQGGLIVAGQFNFASGILVNKIAKWDGNSWSSLGEGLNGTAYCLATFGSDLIVGGSFTMAGGVPANRIAKWNGTSWSSIGSGTDSTVYSLAIDQTQLYAGGTFNTAGGLVCRGVARWNGETWSPVGGGLPNTQSPWVYAMTFYENRLIVGGRFDGPGVATQRNLAQWDGTQWVPFGGGFENEVISLKPFGSELMVGGGNLIGGAMTAYWGRWGPKGVKPIIETHSPSPFVCAGSAVSMTTEATGAGVLSYRWRKSGVELVDGGEMMGTYTDTLVFVHAGVTDAGEYDCVVKLNDCTQATSNIATLTVYPTNTADGNGDAVVDGRDVQGMVDALVGFSPVSAGLCAYELNGDGIVSEADVDAFVGRVLTD